MDVALLLLMLVVGLFFYFLPAFVASNRGNPNTTAIFILDLLLGWSLVGRVVALVWACSGENRKVAAGAKVYTCPYCDEEIRPAAIKCKHCGSEVTPTT
ncbi:superinfection immunity protein [Rhodanobacter sp. T12-5]|uniref:superinfection immunity protein n=1 Tax=Rhodanobacter sp. T12-5 TaxID=2024611 RepID=UPI0011ED1646|nr:superinfection immunity protein [Rhodanobacter sp. T12-5]KAA0068456.1 superinfection immunity protein [Rhodanobacter sp. T12-5]